MGTFRLIEVGGPVIRLSYSFLFQRNYPTSGTTDPGTSQQYKPLIATTSHAPGSRADLTGSSSSKLALLTPAKE